ncbi:MAG: hypothetical protein LBT26_05200 [Clostridiales Family XIII bacterium]|nr:hypothetical protein [Clostridiales Family XIII bacterium]
MKYAHTKFFVIFYAIAMLMMGTPLINIANKPVMLLGMPMLLTWLTIWSVLVIVALIIHYQADLKAEKNSKTQ